MASLIVAVIVGFTFNYDPNPSNELNISNNAVLFHRVSLFKDWFFARNFSPEDMGKLKIILSGRGVVRKDLITGKDIPSDVEKLKKGLTEATMMKKYIDHDSNLNGKLTNEGFLLDENSRVTIENAIFTFWKIKCYLTDKTKVPMKEKSTAVNGNETAKDQKTENTVEVNANGKIVIDFNFFTSDFHLARSYFLFKLFYDAVLSMRDPVLKDIDIPVLNDKVSKMENFSESAIFPDRIISTNGETAKDRDKKNFETTTFNKLKSSKGTGPTGFFGFLESDELKTWEAVAKLPNENKVKELTAEVENEAEFKEIRGITEEDDKKGIVKFYKDLLKQFSERLAAIDTLIV